MEKDPSLYLMPILCNIDENIGRLSPKFVGEFVQILFHVNRDFHAFNLQQTFPFQNIKADLLNSKSQNVHMQTLLKKSIIDGQ